MVAPLNRIAWFLVLTPFVLVFILGPIVHKGRKTEEQVPAIVSLAVVLFFLWGPLCRGYKFMTE